MRRSDLVWGALGLALLVGVPAAWLQARPAPSVGTISTPAVGSPVPAATSTPPAVAPLVPNGDPLAAVRPQDAPAPTAVRIPSLGVEANVVEVGVDDRGEMEIPEDVQTVGWYRFGPRPGQDGSVVVAGHVDSRSQGRGAFYDLTLLDVGDEVEVALTDGTVQRYVVQGRETVDKDVIPLDDVFDRTGPPRLTLITCGGEFDYGTGHYVSNVVVVAVPVSA